MSTKPSKTNEEQKMGCPMGHNPGSSLDANQAQKLSYNNYLLVDKLKELQVCQSDPAHHDEPLFIVIHQAYELWFKEILHEIDQVGLQLQAVQLRKATFYMKRINAILKLLVGQIHILETMSPKDFLGFRSNLNPASGFQSSQFREIEFAGGLKDESILENFRLDNNAYNALKRRYEAPSLADMFGQILAKHDFTYRQETNPNVGQAVIESLAQVVAADDKLNGKEASRLSSLRTIYSDADKYGDLYDLAESFVDFDEQLHLWRANHVLVVERIIGFKPGTGGSEGVAYLQTTLAKRCFPELWKVRTLLQEPLS